MTTALTSTTAAAEQLGGELGAQDDAHPWQRPAPTATQGQLDLAGAVGLFVLALLSMALHRVAEVYPEPAGPWLSVATLAGLTLPLGWRRRNPCAVLAIVSVAFVVAGETAVPEQLVGNIALFIAIYTVGAWESNRRRALIARLVVVVVMFLWLLISFFRIAADPPPGEAVEFGLTSLTPVAAYMLVQLLINVLYFAGAIWFGNHAWRAAVQRLLLLRRARELQAERATVEQQAVTIERMRLARELHDAVAHHVSLMGIQAAAARTLQNQDPERAASALERVEESAREAIDELHSLLGTLRDDPPGGDEESDQDDEAIGSLGVDRIPALMDGARDNGLEVSYQVIGEPVPVRPVSSLNLYRIAQEALTNARKHAGTGAAVDARLRYLPDAVELEIADDGAGRRRRPMRTDTGGLGQLGRASWR